MHRNGASLTVGVDIGGTFTDVVAVAADGSVHVAKATSTPPNYAEGVLDALAKLGIRGENIEHFAHGTTAATNAILTKTGASTGLITTKGFRDVLELRRGSRAELYNYWWRPPDVLVSRHDRLEARERIGFDGEVVDALAEADVANAVEAFQARGLRSVAICFLNSFVNGEHERRAEAMVRELWPAAYVCASVNVIPEILEFERTSTTVANAYVGPIIGGYLTNLLEALRSVGYGRDVLVMSSAGNVMTVETALEVPISTALSGLAAGAMAGVAVAESVGRPNLLTLDVGGTSSDIALIWNSQPRLTTEWSVEFGLPIKLAAIDIHTIGAGGGSIAHVDVGGVLHVGPRSAGADPGPACYGRGGKRATTTDVQVVLGRLDVDLWEELYGWPLNIDAAKNAIVQDVGEALDLPLMEAAEAILEVTINNLAEAIRVVSVERGYDPRSFALAAYGGAGPMYAVDVARALEIPEVVIPPAPGVTSALGLLQVDLAVHSQRSLLMREDALDAARIDVMFREMEEETRGKLARGGYESAETRRQVDVRYFGQSRYLTVDAPNGEWTESSTEAVIAAFTAEHEREYGYLMPSHISLIEIANLRVIAEYGVEKTRMMHSPSQPDGVGGRDVYFKGTGFIYTPTYGRGGLSAGAAFEGPALVEQPDSTTVLPPGSAASVDASGNIVIQALKDD